MPPFFRQLSAAEFAPNGLFDFRDTADEKLMLIEPGKPDAVLEKKLSF
jgi:hypothetical protein